MKAVVYARYGPPETLRLADVQTPVPKDDEVLVKVHAVSLNGSDWEVLRGKPLYSRIGGPFRPRHQVLGSDIAGRWRRRATAPRYSGRVRTCSQTSQSDGRVRGVRVRAAERSCASAARDDL